MRNLSRVTGCFIVGVLLSLSVPVAGAAGGANQTDWSGGIAAVSGEAWGTTSAEASGISWLAIPGQMVLSSSFLEVPVKQIIDDNFLDACSAVAGDIDDDGRTDVVASAWEGNEVAWWRNEGGDPILWVRHSIDNDFSGASSVHTADVDSDGDLDVLGSGMKTRSPGGATTAEIRWSGANRSSVRASSGPIGCTLVISMAMAFWTPWVRRLPTTP